ncbi:hypothetical protein ACVBEJ_00250 [Porticoccus sp. GXU_MW_L64]
MKRVLQITQYFICLISAVFTCLFAIEIGQVGKPENTLEGNGLSYILGTVLLVCLGVAIDACKYIFWRYRARGVFNTVTALTLMLFSWLASCAFFFTSEVNLLSGHRDAERQVESLNHKITSLQSQAENLQRLANKRFDSAYHSQWQRAQEDVQAIADVKAQVAMHIQQKAALTSELAPRLASRQLFTDISALLGFDSRWIRMVFYGLLGLLLEVSSLGMISLNTPRPKKNKTKRVPTEAELFQQREAKAIRIAMDVILGNVKPSLRQCQAAGYGVSRSFLKLIFKCLEKSGLIEQSARKSGYQLSLPDSKDA